VYTTSESKNAKYEGEVEAKNGSVTITMESGSSNKDCIVTLVGVGPQIIVPQEPYGGKIAELPGKIEAENYDITGSGKGNNSYYDMDGENKGKAYREDGVDIEEIKCDEAATAGENSAANKCYGVGYTQAGEWMEYTVNVKTAGEYVLTVRAAAGGTSGSLQFFMDDKAITDTIAVPQTADNDWSVYKNINAGKVKLEAGKHTLKLAITGSYANIDWINIGEENEADDKTTIHQVVRINMGNSAETYGIFDMNGISLGQFSAFSTTEASNAAKKIVRDAGFAQGSYIVKSRAGSALIHVK